MRIADLLSQTRLPLLADGAFGTYFRGLTHSDAPCELANIDQPELVRDIHRRYLQAGARVLLSNTFAANFQMYADNSHLQAVIEAGLGLAQEAANGGAAVLADMGPMEFRSNSCAVEPDAAYLSLAEIFCRAGAEDFAFETMPSFAELIPALEFIRQKQPDAFVLVSFAVSQDGYSKNGLYYKDLLDAAYSSGLVSGAGLNCLCGPGHMARLLASYDANGRLLAASPNAGYPIQVNQRLIYEDNVDYYAARMAELAALGCFMVGGCCGTTPAHIGKAAELLSSPLTPKGGVPPLARGANPCVGPANYDKPGPQSRGDFARKLQQRQQIVVVELNPPISADVEHFMSAARLAHEAGADIISITDSPLARVRADSLMLAAKVQRELGIETLPHLSCRDRNRLGLQSALLGAAIEGIRYVLAVRGDTGEDAVFSLNSRQLISFISSLNRELLADAGFICGGALNVNAANFPAELKRALSKQEAGCAFFLTQPVLDENAADHTALAAHTLDVPVLAGILPLAGYKNALFLQQEVAGIHIPEELIGRLKGADSEEARAISMEHSRHIMSRLRNLCGGFYFSTPLNRIDMVCELAAEARKNV